MSQSPMRSLCEAISYFQDTMSGYPEREALDACRTIWEGRPRRYPMISLNHLADPADTFVPTDELELRPVDMPAGRPRSESPTPQVCLPPLTSPRSLIWAMRV